MTSSTPRSRAGCFTRTLAEYDEYEDDLVVMPDYRFSAVPGMPRPETALRRAVRW